MPFTGNTKLTSGIKQKNNLTFALVDSADVYVEDNDSAKKFKSLAEKLAEIDTSTSTGVDNKIKTAIEALDSEKTIDGNSSFIRTITQVDGKITAVSGKQPESTDISDFSSAVDGRIDSKINNLDSEKSVEGDHSFVRTIVQENGVITSVTGKQPASTDISDFNSAVNGLINTKVESLDSTKSVESNKHLFATTVKQVDGVITEVTGAQPVIDDVDGLQSALDSKQGNLSEGTGISIESNTVAITDEVNQNVVGATGYTDLGTTLSVTYSDDEHKMETVLDNLADRAIDYDNRLGSLEYSGFSVSGGSCTPNEAEIGDTVSSVTLKWSVTIPSLPGTTRNPSKQQIRASNGTTVVKDNIDVALRQTTLSSLSVTGTTSWRPYVYLVNTIDPKYTSGTITFKNREKYGAVVDPGTYDETFIKNYLSGSKLVTLTKLDYKDRATSPYNFTVDASSGGKYAFVALPVSFGDIAQGSNPRLVFEVGGFEGGFIKVNDSPIVYTNYDSSINYNIFRSNQINPGNIVVTCYTAK